MALHIQLRNGSAATWTSTNPILAIGEPGAETDTGLFKIGDGITTWNSLAYQGSTGPTQTATYRSFGDGADGNVTISSGTTTAVRDMYYNNLILNGTGKLVSNGYKIFIKNILDITAAGVGAIQWNGNAGGNASAATGGSAPTAQNAGSISNIAQGGGGATATTGNGTAGTVGSAITGNGGIGGASGSGGTGTSGNGGAGSTARTPNSEMPIRKYETNFLIGTTLIGGGAAGDGAGAGAGDGTNVGGGGGGGGNGGGLLALYANFIIKSSSTPANCIQANGGAGGNGGNTSAGITGGGGGGSGGGGGWAYVCYNNLFGPIIASLLQSNGGAGGNGGSGTGAGATGGNGGNSGAAGRITVINIPTTSCKEIIGDDNTSISVDLVGSPNFGLTGGSGALVASLNMDL